MLELSNSEANILKSAILSLEAVDNRSSLEIPDSVYSEARDLKEKIEEGERTFELTSNELNTVQLMCESMRIAGGYIKGLSISDAEMQVVVAIEDKTEEEVQQ